MKRYLTAAIAALLVGAFLFPASALAGAKADVCHSEGNGSYHLINVSENALPKHLDHGDAAPGSDAPDMTGYAFDDNCVPIGPSCYDNTMEGYQDLEYSGEQDAVGNIVVYLSEDGSCSGGPAPFELALVIATDSGEAGNKCNSFDGMVFMGAPLADLGWADFQPDEWLCELAS